MKRSLKSWEFITPKGNVRIKGRDVYDALHKASRLDYYTGLPHGGSNYRRYAKKLINKTARKNAIGQMTDARSVKYMSALRAGYWISSWKGLRFID